MKLRPLCEKDIPLMLEWMKDAELNHFFRFDATKITENSVREFVKEALNDECNLHYAVVDASDEYLGTISLKNIDLKNRNAEYAIALRSKAIGIGIARFASEEILRIAFSKLNLEKVYLNVLSYNTRAIAFYEKMGFTFEGEFKKHIMMRQKLEDLKWYARYREEEHDV